eukprot:GFUD01014118.1.p1 GENE.GFUD01014118.1~~GFUD01014118.1.p1  ORF type:complete len:403 (+),score=101.21 GFUD01014118.1:308-1516(+)
MKSQTSYLMSLSPNSKSLKQGLDRALSRLNYEFSDAKDAIKANIMSKKVPAYEPNKANTMLMVGNISVGEMVPVESARQILIATTWRSGSTFLGDLLNHYPGVFYFFEPLHYYSSIADKSQVQNETTFLKSLFSCQFDSENYGFLQHVAQPNNKFLFKSHNQRLWNSCKNLLPREALCLLPEYLSRLCPLYPIKLVKTVRIRVRMLEDLLKNSSKNLKVIVLVRDPRGVYNSRGSGPVSVWCSADQCSNPATGCQDLSSDIQAAFDLEKRRPGTVMLVRYEDLSLVPEETARRIMKFLDLPWTEAIADYIVTHTAKDKVNIVRNKKTRKIERQHDPYDTRRNSSARAFAWRAKLGFAKTSSIQEVCRDTMEQLGYRLVVREEDLMSQDRPLDKTAQEVWPEV